MSPVYIGWWEFRRMGMPFEAQGFVRSMSPKGGLFRRTGRATGGADPLAGALLG